MDADAAMLPIAGAPIMVFTFLDLDEACIEADAAFLSIIDFELMPLAELVGSSEASALRDNSTPPARAAAIRVWVILFN